MNIIETLNETQVHFTMRAKDAFFNLGGFKTSLIVLASRLKFTGSSIEEE